MILNSASCHREKGFTLLELLVALAVAGILATLVAPSFAGFLARQQLASDVNEVVSALSFARSEAIKRRQEVAATIDSTSDTWQIAVAVASSSETLRVATGRQSAVSMEGVDSVSFGSLGAIENCSASPCRLTLSHSRFESEGDDKVIIITPAGGVRRED
ncbi:GspH/FimT family pseudopilin [Halomonas sp. LS-001]